MEKDNGILKNSFTDMLRVEGVNFKGYGIIPKYVMIDPALTLEAKGIYAYFCSFSGNGNCAFPTRDRILADLQIGKDAYYRHFRLLCEEGYITVCQTKGERSTFARNIYTLVSNPKKLDLIESEQADSVSQISFERIRISGVKAWGYGMIPKAVMLDLRLPLKAKALYAYFCSFTGAGNCAFPRLNQITAHIGIALKAYYKYFNLLQQYDYISVVQRRICGKMGVNDYYLNDMPDETNGKKGLGASEESNLESGIDKDTYLPIGQNPDTVEDANLPVGQNPDTVEDANLPIGQNPDTVEDSNLPIGQNPDTVEDGNLPVGQNLDAVEDANLPVGQNPDTVKECDLPISQNPDTQKSDTQNQDTNSNNINNNNVNNTKIPSLTLIPSEEPKTLPTAEKGRELTDEEIRTEICRRKCLPYIYKTNELAMTKAIHFMTGWNYRYPCGYTDELMQRTYNLFNEALIQMCMADHLQLKGCYVTYAKVIDRINKLAKFYDGYVDLEEFADVAMNNFYKAASATQIRFPLRYMQSCIWDALLSGNIELFSSLKRELEM